MDDINKTGGFKQRAHGPLGMATCLRYSARGWYVVVDTESPGPVTSDAPAGSRVAARP